MFASQEQHPYVGGEFVWTGWDYLGEPTPFYSSRSSYSGIIDLAGFKKDRFYLYQAHWRPDFPMAHILPHWTWPDRVGQITPVHVFTSGDEAELFLNGKSLGKKTKGQYEYRLRWDDVTYQPGELKVVAYKKGKEWATDVMRTAGPAAKLLAQADRSTIAADGQDLSFVTITIADQDDILVPRSRNRIRFSIDGPGEIVATDNGDPTSFESFQSKERNAFNGLCLAIVRAKPGQTGTITIEGPDPRASKKQRSLSAVKRRDDRQAKTEWHGKRSLSWSLFLPQKSGPPRATCQCIPCRAKTASFGQPRRPHQPEMSSWYSDLEPATACPHPCRSAQVVSFPRERGMWYNRTVLLKCAFVQDRDAQASVRRATARVECDNSGAMS